MSVVSDAVAKLHFVVLLAIHSYHIFVQYLVWFKMNDFSESLNWIWRCVRVLLIFKKIPLFSKVSKTTIKHCLQSRVVSWKTTWILEYIRFYLILTFQINSVCILLKWAVEKSRNWLGVKSNAMLPESFIIPKVTRPAFVERSYTAALGRLREWLRQARQLDPGPWLVEAGGMWAGQPMGGAEVCLGGKAEPWDGAGVGVVTNIVQHSAHCDTLVRWPASATHNLHPSAAPGSELLQVLILCWWYKHTIWHKETQKRYDTRYAERSSEM